MIPKIIHCVWLSGDEKPKLYADCLASWKRCMPDYEIREWDISMVPTDLLFVQQAIAARKWAYATDYLRLYILYNYGGIYMDLDVMVYKSFDPFLHHRAFSCIEFYPNHFYPNVIGIKTIYKPTIGVGIEAAVIGAEKGHPWISDIMSFYIDREFINEEKYYISIIMPRVMNAISMNKYGFRSLPIYQELREGVVVYPPDTFSSCFDKRIISDEFANDIYSDIGVDNPIRYAYHMCAHSWWEGFPSPSIWVQFKRLISRICR